MVIYRASTIDDCLEASETDNADMALIAKALSHPVRVEIVRILTTQPECAGFQVFGSLPLAQSTVSQHLRQLKDAGIVDSHPVGQGQVYCLNADLLSRFATSITDVVCAAPTCPPTAGSANA